MRGYKFLMEKANLHQVDVIQVCDGKLFGDRIEMDNGGIAKVKSVSGADYIVYTIDGGLGCSCPWGQQGANGHRSFCSHTLAVLGTIANAAGYTLSVCDFGCCGPDCYELWDGGMVQITDDYPALRQIFGDAGVRAFIAA